MGGEITIQHLFGSDYAIVATAYRDTVGISMAFNLPITITNQTTGWDTVLNVSHDTIISGNLVPFKISDLPFLLKELMVLPSSKSI